MWIVTQLPVGRKPASRQRPGATAATQGPFVGVAPVRSTEGEPCAELISSLGIESTRQLQSRSFVVPGESGHAGCSGCS